MANHASAAKRNRERLKKTARNRAVKSTLRGSIKAARSAIVATPATAKPVLIQAESALDRAASKGVISTRRASRLKGRLASALAAKSSKAA